MSIRAFTRAPAVLFGLGLTALIAALFWWGVVFGVVLQAEVLSPREAAICFIDSSGLCQAIASLCTRDHPLNIRVYSPELTWAALGLIAAGLIAGCLVSGEHRGQDAKP